MGVDVRDLMRQSQTSNSIHTLRVVQNVKMVIFTFVGPEGLIEGGDN